MYDVLIAISVIVAAFLTALSVLLVFAMMDRRRTGNLRQSAESERDAIVFVFENEDLLDATPAARNLMETASQHGTPWSHLASLLTPRFPGFSDQMKDLADLGALTLVSSDGTSRVRAEWHEGLARISIESADFPRREADVDGLSFKAMTQELEALRDNADHTPYPLWRENDDGEITWCNGAYLDLVDSLREGDRPPAWPPAHVFEFTDQGGGDENGTPQRVAISPPGQDKRHWFEVTARTLDRGGRFLAAVPADRLVRAEKSLEEFVTTLTKTFASLPIGLAIFDRSRALALFNPALMDLTLLPAEFLISKPSLSAFLDRLREARMMPEPKDYRSWRQQMSDLEAAAQNGTYEETWALPTGQTYRVTGRPHPDGAVALLFEDISAEITANRRFRAELETSQAALDALPQAVAVFTAGGILSISNAGYARIWGNDPSTTLGDITIADAVQRWQSASAPTPVWDRLRAYVTQPGAREKWSATVPLANGQMLNCEVSPLARGATLVSFTQRQVGTGHSIETARTDAISTGALQVEA